MNTEVSRLPESRVTLKIELSPEEVDASLERTYKQLVQRVNVPGFRKGKAPRAVVERLVGPEVFLHEATDEAVRWGYRKAIEAENLTPIEKGRGYASLIEDLGLTREELAVVVEEAHRMGYRVCAHCEGLAGTELAIEAGIDTIEHGMYLNQRPDLLERMATNGQVLVPTLSFLLRVADSSEWTPQLVDLGKHNVEQAHLTLVAARDAGVRLAVGHDSAPLRAGMNELLRMIEAGLTPNEALVAATSGGAYAVGLADHVGTVEPGKLADLVVVDGDPLAEPKLLSERARIWLVLRVGAPVAGTALESSV